MRSIDIQTKIFKHFPLTALTKTFYFLGTLVFFYLIKCTNIWFESFGRRICILERRVNIRTKYTELNIGLEKI